MEKKKVKVAKEELKIVFLLAKRMPEQFAQDLPFSVQAYAGVELTNEIYLFYQDCKSCRDKDFMIFVYLQLKTKWLNDKFYKIISDLKKWAGENIGANGKGKRTDMSPLRRRALADYFAWQK